MVDRANLHAAVPRVSTMIELRPKQNLVMQSIRDAYAQGFKAPLLVAPCGFGKTVVFSAMAESAERRQKRVLILCHRVELVDQIVATLKEFGVSPDIIAAGFQRSCGRSRASTRSIAVASVQTLVRRLDEYPPPTLITIDECHHAVSTTWSTIIRKFPEAKLLGVTASPVRGYSRGLGAMFDKLILGPTVTELTDAGLLAKVAKVAEDTYISPNYLAHGIAYEWCRRGRLAPQIEKLKALYAPRLDACLAARFNAGTQKRRCADLPMLPA